MANGHGRGCLAAAIAGIGVAGLATWFGWTWLGGGFSHAFGPDNHVAATASRVCRSTGWNNVPFDQVMGHFRLKLPPGAQDVVFTANVNPLFGEYSLALRFTTTAAALRSFLANAGLAPASLSGRRTIEFGPASCGLNPLSASTWPTRGTLIRARWGEACARWRWTSQTAPTPPHGLLPWTCSPTVVRQEKSSCRTSGPGGQAPKAASALPAGTTSPPLPTAMPIRTSAFCSSGPSMTDPATPVHTCLPVVADTP